MVPTIDLKLKQEDLPTWDGNPSTAIQYFWCVQQCTTLGGYIPAALGYWLWLKLKEGSDVQYWFATLPFAEQTKMRGHWVDYLKGIKEGYLGRTWQFDIGEDYKNQYFRQPGFEHELPKSFIARRIMYTRMLAKSHDGGPLEVHLVMAKAPLSWQTILVLENITSSSLLYTKAAEHQQSLLEASKTGVTNIVTMDNLALHLRQLGYSMDRTRFQQSLPQDRRAHLTSAEPTTDVQPKEIFISSAIHKELDPTSMEERASMEDEILKEVYQVMKKKQRAPPPGGYMFSKNDHVTTKMGRLPLSLCKCCGNKNHWDKECPDLAVYIERTSKSSYQNEKEFSQEDDLYQSAYGALLSQRVASMQVDETKLGQDFRRAIHIESVRQTDDECKAREAFVGHVQVSMEEIEDEDHVAERNKPKSPTHLLIHVDEDKLPDTQDKCKHPSPTKHPMQKQKVVIEEIEDESWKAYRMKPKSMKHILDNECLSNGENCIEEEFVTAHTSQKQREELLAETDDIVETARITDIPPPLKIDKPIRLHKKRVTPPGLSALGVSVLSTKVGWAM